MKRQVPRLIVRSNNRSVRLKHGGVRWVTHAKFYVTIKFPHGVRRTRRAYRRESRLAR